MNTALPYLLLTRPVNVVIGGLSIFVGALVTGTIQPLHKVLCACLSGALIAAGANAVNDYFDVAIDRQNKPHRPLPSGLIPPRSAFLFANTLLVCGASCGVLVNNAAFVIAALSAALLYVYSYKLKRTVLMGNLAVSLVTGLAFIYGGVAVGRVGRALIPAAFALLFHLGREIIKDIEDIEGDRLADANTLPIRFGTHKSLVVATVVFVLLVIATLIPYITFVFSRFYLYIVVLGVDSVLIFVIISMWRRQTSAHYHFLSNLLKADMLIGLIAIYVG